MPKGVVVVSNMAKPEWCLAVNITYRMPASRASRAPIRRVEGARIERLRQFLEEPVGIFRRSAHQRMADDDAQLAIHAPMDEQAETLVTEPLQPVCLIERPHLVVVLRTEAGRNDETCGNDKGKEDAHFMHAPQPYQGFTAHPAPRPRINTS